MCIRDRAEADRHDDGAEVSVGGGKCGLGQRHVLEAALPDFRTAADDGQRCHGTDNQGVDEYPVSYTHLKSALAPLLIVWLGNNMKTIIVAAVSVAVFGSILTLYTLSLIHI